MEPKRLVLKSKTLCWQKWKSGKKQHSQYIYLIDQDLVLEQVSSRVALPVDTH